MSGEIHKHPHRYPKHEGDKGQRLGGICNTTACANEDATFFNNQTYGLYCPVCARGINHFERQLPICAEVDHQLTVAEMDEIRETDDILRYPRAS